jgi:hypothetical protein
MHTIADLGGMGVEEGGAWVQMAHKASPSSLKDEEKPEVRLHKETCESVLPVKETEGCARPTTTRGKRWQRPT